MNKRKALVLFIIYAIAVVLVLTFGTKVARAISAEIKEALLPYEITDVKVGLDMSDGLLSSSTYNLDCTPVGQFTEDGNLVFTSSNTDVLYLNDLGTVYTTSEFEGSETTVEITITSRQDTDFVKVIPVTVRKLYPTQFITQYVIKGAGYNKKNIQLGMVVYPYGLPASGSEYTSNEFEVIYDEEYFEYSKEEGGYIAIKETKAGEKIHFTIRYPDGREAPTPEFSIVPYKGADSFEEIRISGKKGDSFTVKAGGAITPTLFTDDNTVQSKLQLIWSDPRVVKLNNLGRFVINQAGDYTLTVVLENGFSKSVSISVRNELSLPIPEEEEIASSKVITVYEGSRKRVNFTLPDKIKYKNFIYEYDSDKIEVKTAWRSFIIVAGECGSTELKIVVDDGFERLEEVYTVNVVKDTRASTVIKKAATYFVSKVLGHISMFALLGALAFNMLRFYERKNLLIRLLEYIPCGLPVALLTEIIQISMEGRTASFTDVIIDMSSYVVGVAVTIAIYKYIEKRKIYVWCAVDLNRQLKDQREAAEGVGEELGVSNPALTLPLHISLKISCRIGRSRVKKAVKTIGKRLSKSVHLEIKPLCIERCGGVVWIRHEESPQLKALHEWLVRLFKTRYGVTPHEFDLDFAYHSSLFVGDEVTSEAAYELLRDIPLPERLIADGFVIGISESGKAGEYKVVQSVRCRG